MLGSGQMVGEDDGIFNRPYSYSVVCKSNTAHVFRIKSAEFFKKMQAHDVSWRIIC